VSDRVDPGLLEAELRARRDHVELALDKAVWSLVVGEADEGLRIIADYLTEAPADEGPTKHRAELAVVAGNWEEAARSARLAPVENFVTGYRDYVAAMLALIAGEEEEARTRLEHLDEYVSTRDKLRSGHPAAVAEIPRGLLERDADRVAAGVEALLGWHLRRARARSEIFNSARAVVSVEAMVGLLLAHRRGVFVPVAAKYRAASVPLLVLYLSEWEGRPLPRGLQLSVDVDLVAGSWLGSHGLNLGEPPPAKPPRSAPRARTRRPSTTGEDFVRHSLRLLEQEGKGSAWQLTSWALILGDAERARAHLRQKAIAAEARWKETAPEQGRGLRWLWRSQGLPNHKYVREHFGVALVLGDEGGLVKTTSLLIAWADAVEADMRRRGQTNIGRYAHADGYLDLLAALLEGTVNLSRAEAEQVFSPLRSTRVACVGLVEHDPALLREGLEGMLGEHAKTLERKSSPPPPLSFPSIHLAACARRLGMPVAVDERYSAHPVPVQIRNLPGHEGRVGRVPCDLLGRQVWDRD
jgi:hypothetical protein